MASSVSRYGLVYAGVRAMVVSPITGIEPIAIGQRRTQHLARSTELGERGSCTWLTTV